jgi:hypothetical protein
MGGFAESRYLAWERLEAGQNFPAKGHSPTPSGSLDMRNGRGHPLRQPVPGRTSGPLHVQGSIRSDQRIAAGAVPVVIASAKAILLEAVVVSPGGQVSFCRSQNAMVSRTETAL